MPINIVELKKVSKHNIVIFPYAGGLHQSYISIIPSITDGCGLLVAEYPNIEESANINFSYLAKRYATLLMNLDFSNMIFIGISFGGYIAFKIIQIVFTVTKIIPKTISLLSVMDIPSLLTQINDPNFDILSIIKANDDINNIDVLQESRQLITKDIEILRTLQINTNIKVPMDLTIINGSCDPICHNGKTYAYWEQLVSGQLYVKSYIGTHLPNHEIIASIFSLNRVII